MNFPTLFQVLDSLIPKVRGKNRLLMLVMRFIPWQPIGSAYGPRLFGDRRDLTYQFAVTGSYGTRLSREIELLPRDAVFVDIGANIGLYSILASQHLRQGQVIAFEPNPFTYRHLVSNVRYHNAMNVTMLPCALGSDSWELLQLNFDWKHMGKASLSEKQKLSTDVLIAGKNILDMICLLNKAQIFIKIDVEGAEIKVLKTLADWAEWGRVTDIFIEISQNYHDEGDVKWIYAFFNEHGFSARYAHEDHYDQHFERNTKGY